MDRLVGSVAAGAQREDDPAGGAVVFDAIEHAVHEPALLARSEGIEVICLEEGLQLMQHELLDLGSRKRATGTGGAAVRWGARADIVAPAP